MDTLDTSQNQAGPQVVNVDSELALIKREMPMTYAAVQAWAASIGNKAFEQVRRGLRGEYRCFWAYEAGYVLGEIWHPDFATESALRLERFGCAHVDVRLGMGVQDGTN